MTKRNEAIAILTGGGPAPGMNTVVGSVAKTFLQKGSMLALLRELRLLFPKALIVGHHDLNPVKPCPCFDAVKEYRF